MTKVFMGVSIKNPFYAKEENILRAINLAKDFDEFLIFVVDFPYRLSLQAFKNSTAEEAQRNVLKEGAELKRFLINKTKQFKNVKINSWNELIDENYCRLLLEIQDLEKNDKKFSQLVEGEFTGTVISKLGQDFEKKRLSKDFIMEEIAIFSSLAVKGFSKRISKYPKSKSVDYFLKRKNIYLDHIQIN